MTDIKSLGIDALSDLLEAKAISPSEILDDVIDRLDVLEPELNMFAALDIEGARVCAKAADERQMSGGRLSKLDGIPTSIKDLIAQKDLPLRFGSKATNSQPAQVDAPSVKRLRAAGAVLLGKSTSSEFGCKAVGDSPLTGITRNPWDKSKTPGGSSCGAAAMVGAGLVPYALGTDGGGSVRIPAALCGLFGIKAQFGRVPVFPVSATPTLAHVGPLTRSVKDAATVLSMIAGPDFRDPFSIAETAPDYVSKLGEKRKLKICWSPTLGFARPDKEIVEVVSDAVLRLRDLGHDVEQVDHIMDDPCDMWTAEFYAGVGSKLRGVIENSPNELDPSVLEVLKKAVTQEMDEYYASVFKRYEFREVMRKFFNRYDVLISPTLPCAAFDVGKDVPDFLSDRTIVSWVFYTYAFNLTGQPAASVPAGLTKDGLPVGMQLVGRINDEATILNLSAEFEEHKGGFETAAST
ncbi:MAG: amidase family protein [Hyphomicrobiales bacterium]